MAANVKVDLIGGNSGRLDRSGWVEKACKIVVRNLSHSLGDDDLCLNAVTAADAAGFTAGSQHPELTDLYLLGDRSVTVISDTVCEINAVYQRPDETNDPNYTAIRGGIVLAQEKTNKDAGGNDIYTEWKPDATRDARTQPGTVDIWLPCRTLEFSKLLEVNPAADAADIVGYLNDDTFQGDDAGYWLCMGCEFSSGDGGYTWQTSYRFAHSPRQWKHTIYYVLDNGRIPDNWDAAYNTGKTVKTIEVYGVTDFSFLGLPDVMSPAT